MFESPWTIIFATSAGAFSFTLHCYSRTLCIASTAVCLAVLATYRLIDAGNSENNQEFLFSNQTATTELYHGFTYDGQGLTQQASKPGVRSSKNKWERIRNICIVHDQMQSQNEFCVAQDLRLQYSQMRSISTSQPVSLSCHL